MFNLFSLFLGSIVTGNLFGDSFHPKFRSPLDDIQDNMYKGVLFADSPEKREYERAMEVIDQARERIREQGALQGTDDEQLLELGRLRQQVEEWKIMGAPVGEYSDIIATAESMGR